MRKILVTLALLFTCGLSGFGSTESETMDSGEKEKTRLVHRSNQSSNSSRPNMPSKVYILCEYSAANIDFIIPSGIEWLNLKLGSEMFPVWVGFVNKSCPSVTIPEFTGEVEITCEDNLGRKYYGMLYFGQD